MLNLTDYFLVAAPSMNDGIFGKSVVYITSYNEGAGSVGVIVNKPLGKKLENVFLGLDFSAYNPSWSDKQLYFGGPVSAGNGFVLHRKANATNSDSMFELTNNRDVLDKIAMSDDKSNLFVSIGYSSWIRSQLESEIVRNDWLVVKANPELIYDVEPINRYDEALKLLGITDKSYLYTNEVAFA